MNEPFIKCTGCGITAEETGDYDPDNPVQDDGTFEDNKFVCMECYDRLISFRDKGFKPDVGSPREVQEAAQDLLKDRI